MIDLQSVLLGGVVVGLAGAFLSYFGIRDPYADVGHGSFALDVPDSVPPPPLDSGGGQAEVQQLLEAIEAVRSERRERGG